MGWKIKQIFDGDYGCEALMPGEKPKVSVYLTDDEGREKCVRVEDEWLLSQELDEGDEWPEYSYDTADRYAQPEVRRVLEYLKKNRGKNVIAGQHTQTMPQEELQVIYDVTGKYPGLIGFEMLSYSPNINYLDTDVECMDEVTANLGTLRKLWEWADRGALITISYHWFSPLGGRSKSFFSYNTDFDASKALIDGTPENKAFISDLDVCAGLLRPFADAHVPILWRPFHEAEGDWFWWNAKGVEVAGRLYKFMFERFTMVHGLHNLIWVWNAPVKEGYPGDEYVDIISRDMYPPAHEHTARLKEYEELTTITASHKLAAIAETGVLPDTLECVKAGAQWSYFMTWSGEFCIGEKNNSYDFLKKLYEMPETITLDRLPKLYGVRKKPFNQDK